MAEFEDFWAAWPAERHVTKKQSIDQWKRMTETERELAVEDVAWRVQHSYRWQRPAEDGQWAIPHPFRYLRDKRFNDARGREVSGPSRAQQAPAYDPDWCQHEPRCHSRDWHDVVVERERLAANRLAKGAPPSHETREEHAVNKILIEKAVERKGRVL